MPSNQIVEGLLLKSDLRFNCCEVLLLVLGCTTVFPPRVDAKRKKDADDNPKPLASLSQQRLCQRSALFCHGSSPGSEWRTYKAGAQTTHSDL